MKIHILTPVWGESFVDMFLQCTLPCLASEGNLPALARDHEVTFRIFTTPGEARRMACTPLVRHLSTFMEVAFTDLDALEVLEAATVFERMEDASYRKSAGCVLEGLRYAWEEQAGLLFIAPDNVYSDGALARVAEAIDSGKRGLLLGSMAVCEDTFMPALATAAPLDPAGARIIAPRALAHLGLMHRHSWMQGAFLESSSFHIHSTLYWAGDQGGYLARSWHLQPLFLHPQRRADQFFISQDNDLVGQLVEDVRDLEIIVDSDEITLIDIHPKNSNRFFKKVDDPFSPLRFALAAEQVYVSAFNFQHVRHALIFHDVDLTPDWTDLERASDQMVDEIQAWMSFLEPGSWSHPRNLDQKRQQEALSMLDHFRQVVGRASGEAGALAWANLGKLHAAMGHRGEALHAFGRVLDLRPDFIRAVIRVAWAALQLDSTALVDRAILQAQSINPDYFDLGNLLQARFAVTKAGKTADEAIASTGAQMDQNGIPW